MRVLWLKWRDYPIKRDEYGRSARQQAFALFDEGYRPAQIYKKEMIPVPLKTLYRYYEDWKKQKHKISHATLKKYMRESPQFTEKYVQMLADYFEVPPEDIIVRIQKPWGIEQLTSGELPDNRLARLQSETEDRLEAALRLIYLREHLYRNSPKEIKELLVRIVTLRDKNTLIISHVNGRIMIEERHSVIMRRNYT